MAQTWRCLLDGGSTSPSIALWGMARLILKPREGVSATHPSEPWLANPPTDRIGGSMTGPTRQTGASFGLVEGAGTIS